MTTFATLTFDNVIMEALLPMKLAELQRAHTCRVALRQYSTGNDDQNTDPIENDAYQLVDNGNYEVEFIQTEEHRAKNLTIYPMSLNCLLDGCSQLYQKSAVTDKSYHPYETDIRYLIAIENHIHRFSGELSHLFTQPLWKTIANISFLYHFSSSIAARNEALALLSLIQVYCTHTEWYKKDIYLNAYACGFAKWERKDEEMMLGESNKPPVVDNANGVAP